ncbi:hypothetical protein KA529_00645 [Candidatus Saccharibacteria bacterium]|nr:hypothetical protein [Candidatus Saccharibacteria bacterium]
MKTFGEKKPQGSGEKSGAESKEREKSVRSKSAVLKFVVATGSVALVWVGPGEATDHLNAETATTIESNYSHATILAEMCEGQPIVVQSPKDGGNDVITITKQSDHIAVSKIRPSFDHVRGDYDTFAEFSPEATSVTGERWPNTYSEWSAKSAGHTIQYVHVGSMDGDPSRDHYVDIDSAALLPIEFSDALRLNAAVNGGADLLDELREAC